MSLTQQQIESYQNDGYVSIEGVFSDEKMNRAIDQAHLWQEEFLKNISDDDLKWYQDGATDIKNQVRKLDNPVSQRDYFRELALAPELISRVEELIGKNVIAYFSQIFFKPPHGGGPKPLHQDNYYFGPDNQDNIITAWIAFDDAKIENGCLYYGKESHKGPIIDHFAPEGEPFNYQIKSPEQYDLTPAPINKGGVNFHHGITTHQSSNNTSNSWRRAMAVHFLQKDVQLINPIFEFNQKHFVEAY